MLTQFHIGDSFCGGRLHIGPKLAAAFTITYLYPLGMQLLVRRTFMTHHGREAEEAIYANSHLYYLLPPAENANKLRTSQEKSSLPAIPINTISRANNVSIQKYSP